MRLKNNKKMIQDITNADKKNEYQIIDQFRLICREMIRLKGKRTSVEKTEELSGFFFLSLGAMFIVVLVFFKL